ncbi:NUDIX hydrolase [Virgibacillus pantothenticus]|uniref:NUDIX hydrolase n=1 Tax=Virgibacillus pantothenticus TaxID=1473 RepID=UPI003D17EB74
MVLQGKPEEKKTWTVPTGITELHETGEACCIREVVEEKGYIARISKHLYTKKSASIDTII